MNVTWVFAVVLALAGAASAGPINEPRHVERSQDLQDVLNKFRVLVPSDEFTRLLEDYLLHDWGFNNATLFFFSDEFKDAFRKMNSLHVVTDLYDYLEEAGLDAYQIVNELYQAIGLPPLRPRRDTRTPKITGGAAGFIADYKALLPLDKIRALHEEQVKTSPAFARFVDYWNSPRLLEIIEALQADEEFQKQLDISNAGGILMWDIADFYATMFGLELPSRSKKIAKRSLALDADLKDFRALVPEEEIMDLYREYMNKDPEAMFAYAYLRTEEYRKLMAKINDLDDARNVYDYLLEAGLDARALIGLLSPRQHRRGSRSPKITGGPAGYIADIKAILPADEIRALHEEKLKTSPAFAKFVSYWKSPRFDGLIRRLRANQEFQESIKVAKDAGIDLIAIADLYFASLGLQLPGSPVRTFTSGSSVRRAARSNNGDSLERVLDEFGALLPLLNMAPTAFEDYMLNNEDFQKAFAYLRSPAFAKVVQEAESIEEVRNMYNFLENAGLEMHRLVDDLHNFVGLPHVNLGRPSRSVGGTTSGGTGFLADYKALLPLDKVRALHEEKLKTSPAFARFVGLWKSSRFAELVDALRANQKLQGLVEEAKKNGIDVVTLVDLCVTAIGLELPGSSGEKSIVKRSVDDDVGMVLTEFLNLVPNDKYNAMMLDHLENDPGLQEALNFLWSETFRNVVEKIDGMTDVIALYDYLEEAGLEVYTLLNDLHKIMDLPPIKPERSARSVSSSASNGVSSLIADYKAILPIDKIKALHEERLKTSPAFARFIDYLKSPRFLLIIKKIHANKELQEQLKIAKEGGIDIMAAVDLYATVMGVKIPSLVVPKKSIAKRSVDDVKTVLAEFLDLVSIDKYNRMLRYHMENDTGVINAADFFWSESFRNVVEKIEAMPEAIALFDYLEEAGLEVYMIMTELHKAIDLPSLKIQPADFSATGGMSSLIAAYKAILPIDKIKALHEERLKTSQAFARFVRYLKSPYFHKIVEAVRANEELQGQLKVAKDGGIDIMAIVDLYATAMGIKFPSLVVPRKSIAKRSLNSDDLDLERVLIEFSNLVPVEEYNKMMRNHLENDKELHAAFRYFFSNSFNDLFEKINGTKDVIILFDYLEEAGLKVYDFLSPLKPGRSRRSVGSGGASELIANYKAILPIDKIKALHDERLKTSPAFARFVDYLKSPRFLVIIKNIRANKELQELLKVAKEGGIDIPALVDLGAAMVGVELPSRTLDLQSSGSRIAKRSVNLEDDLRKFADLMPRKQLRKILEEYLVHDSGFNDAAEFFFSDDFKDVLKKVEVMDDFTNFLDYMVDAGFDAYSIINDAHFFLGLPPLKSSGRNPRSVKITGGVDGYIADYRAILPFDRIKALHEELLKSSPAFARFVELWKAPRFNELIEALRANEEFQKQLKIVKAGGIDFHAIADLYASMVGLEFPEIEKV